LARARLDGLWTAGERVFAAQVAVCAPVLVRDRERAPVRRASGPSFVEDPPAAVRRDVDRWSRWSYLAPTGGVPSVALDASRTLDELARATAGFRDQYYALDDAVVDEVDTDDVGEDGGAVDERLWPRLVTSGLVDPGCCLWGRRSARFRHRAWSRPRIDLAALRTSHPKVWRWAVDLLVPKVVVATQTRVVEAAVDLDGVWYPSTPTIAVVPRPGELWSVAAVLLAPAVSAWAHERAGGSALARDAIKLSASDVAHLPLPTDGDAWSEGADRLERAVRDAAPAGRPSLDAFAEAMGPAYGVGDEVGRWWLDRLPVRR
jgi:hypothetical protein